MDVICFHLMPYRYRTDNLAWPITENRYDRTKGHDLYHEYLSQMVYCEELGYDAIGVNEHHYRPFGLMPSPNLVASNLAGRTDEIDIAIYGNILPLRDQPIRLAEELAMVDNLCDGRLRSAFIRGLPIEYDAYGIDRDESRERFAEAWELLVRAWSEPDPFDFEGEFFEYDDVFIWPRPYQEPHPPLRMPAASEESIRFAAERRVPTSRVFASTAEIEETFDRYRELAAEAGWTPDDDHFEVARIIYVAETMEQAREEAREHIHELYDDYLLAPIRSAAVQMVGDDEYREEHAEEYETVMRDIIPPRYEHWLEVDFEEYQDRGEIIVGDPSYVAGELERQYETLDGFGSLFFNFHFAGLPDELTRKNLELFADEVMPSLDRLQA